MSLTIKNLNKSFQDINLFKDFNIEIQQNTISCILGPSGCGKTTLLNMISGTLKPDSGSFIGLDDKELSYIFQEPRLLPWKTVKENISFVTNDQNLKDEQKNIVDRYIRLVNLEEFTNYYPNKLSGGMKQRVAIARAFSYPSDLILMDEPFKALDLKLKLNLMKAFRRIWQTDKRTVIFVTHDVDEAIMMGDEIFIFSKNPVKIKKKIINTLPPNSKGIHNPDFISIEKMILKELD